MVSPVAASKISQITAISPPERLESEEWQDVIVLAWATHALVDSIAMDLKAKYFRIEGEL